MFKPLQVLNAPQVSVCPHPNRTASTQSTIVMIGIITHRFFGRQTAKRENESH